AEDGIRDDLVTGVQTCALPIWADAMKAMRIRESIQRTMRDFLGRYDVIVTPNFMSVAPPVDQDLNEALPYGDPVGALAVACGLRSEERRVGKDGGRRRRGEYET